MRPLLQILSCAIAITSTTAAHAQDARSVRADPAHVRKMDSVDFIPEIQRVGRVYAQKHVFLRDLDFGPFARRP